MEIVKRFHARNNGGKGRRNGNIRRVGKMPDAVNHVIMHLSVKRALDLCGGAAEFD